MIRIYNKNNFKNRYKVFLKNNIYKYKNNKNNNKNNIYIIYIYKKNIYNYATWSKNIEWIIIIEKKYQNEQ